MTLSPYSNLNIFGGVTGMPFNQYGCNFLDPTANMIQTSIFGLINMATSYAANHVSSRNVDTPDSNTVNYKELAEAEIDDNYDKAIETAENNLTTASEQYTIITEAQTRLKAIPAEISALESQRITKGTGENGALTPEETKKNEAIQTEIDRLNQEKETKQGEIDKAVEAINKLNIPELGTISEFTSKSVITTSLSSRKSYLGFEK